MNWLDFFKRNNVESTVMDGITIVEESTDRIIFFVNGGKGLLRLQHKHLEASGQPPYIYPSFKVRKKQIN